jgi:hypothetical protein
VHAKWRWLLGLLCLVAAAAWGSGPRFVTGPPFFTGNPGIPIGWKQTQLLYFTDPGALSPSLNHAASDALVASAVGVWNLPQASITVAQGGSLAEHVSGANTYLDQNGMEYPADVMASNAAAIPIAILYDTDGSVTDTLLGSGSSLPNACRTNAVTSTVDSFDPAGYILHAVIVLNGRCTVPTAYTTAAALQLDMQYKLMRAFGRVLGLAWSQTNDNVFTGSPVPTSNQAMHWPIMHPIDIICGYYSYQCMPSPFVLRPDDIASMVSLYPNAQGTNEPAGKQDSLYEASGVQGYVNFPDGQGMTDVNVLVTRLAAFSATPETWFEVSGVTGMAQRRSGLSPFVTAGTDALSSMGSTGENLAGYFSMAYVPVLGTGGFDDLIASTEPVNPLYTGSYTLGPYGPGVVAPAGSPPASETGFIVSEYSTQFYSFNIADAPPACGNGADGTADSPAPVPTSGWWNATLCGQGHTSQMGILVKPGRTLTIEATALDANGLATTTKTMPVIGLFAPTDSDTALPSVGETPSAFNTIAVGTTSLMASTGSLSSLRIGVADQRGEDRPDFSYQGRVFYADEVAPAQVPVAGGTLTITGMGFRAGNRVLVNGIAAQVQSWSANKLVAVAPSLAVSAASVGTPVDVEVLDSGTGATSTLSGALVYSSGAGNAMILVSAPAGIQPTGTAASPNFAVRVVQADGVTPVVGDQVVFSVQAGAAKFGACGARTCTVTTDSTGLAQSPVTPSTDGVTTVQAIDGSLSQVVSFTAETAASSMQILASPSGTQTVGTQVQTPLVVRVFGPANYDGLPNHLVAFTVPVGSGTWNGCIAATCSTLTDSNGIAYLAITPTAAGPVTVQAAADGISQQASFNAIAVSDTLNVTSAPASPAYVNESAGAFSVQLLRPDGSGDYGERVTFTAPTGVTFAACQSSTCVITTDGNGGAGTSVLPAKTGTFTVQAAYGSVTASASLTVGSRSISLKILSVPASGSVVGSYAAAPFTVQLIGLDGVTPVAGATLAIGGAMASVRMGACGIGSCTVSTDSNGMTSSAVMPLQPGAITLSAAYAPIVQTATFTAVGASDFMQVMTQPGPGSVYTGSGQTFTVKLLKPDGSTPDPGQSVIFTVTAGNLSFAGCTASCTVTTDANGLATVQGSATAAGQVAVQAAFGAAAQTMSFSAVAPPDIMRLLTSPASGVPTGAVNPVPFAVQVLQADGVTPIASRAVIFTQTSGASSFGACPQAFCTVYTDSAGRASTIVTANSGGAIGILAADGTVTQAASFTAVAALDVLRVVSAPASPATVGLTSSAPFAVQVLGPDGVTPAAGRSVIFSATSGSVAFGACAGASVCTLTADLNGNAISAVTPLTAGAVTLQAADGTVKVSASYVAQAAPDVLHVIQSPGSGQAVGAPNSSGFIVQVLLADGVTPVVGRSVQLSVQAGSASFGACAAASSCAVNTDASGKVSTTVTSLAKGSTTLQLTDGAVSTTATFIAGVQPDLLRIVSAPSSGGYVGVANGTPFQVQVLQGDGVTPAAGRSIALSVTAGAASFAACGGASTCTLTSDGSGLVTTTVTPASVGTIILQAADGAVTASASFSAITKPDVLQLVSIPADGSFTGIAAAVNFSVRVLSGDGMTPIAGRAVALSTTLGAASLLTCGQAMCSLVTDANGLVSTSVEPLAAGTVTLQAADGAVTISASFTAVDRPNILQLVSTPANGAWVGTADSPAFAVRLLKADGTTPVPGAAILLAAAPGSANFTACGGASCTVTTDATGLASSVVTPLLAGTIAVQASAGSLTVLASFTAVVRPDVLRILSAPSDGALVGDTAALPFTVQVLLGDQSTPAAGRSVTMQLTSGSAQLAACGAVSCVLTANAQGIVSSAVVPLAPGEVTLQAADGAVLTTAAFRADSKPDVLRLTAPPAATVYVGDTTSITVQVLLADGVTAAAGRSVGFSSISGTALLGGCSGSPVCTATTDGTGRISLQITPTAAGTVALQAAETTGAGNSLTVAFAAIVRPDSMLLVSAPQGQVYVGDMTMPVFAVRVIGADGVTPAAGRSVVFSVASGHAVLSACAAAICPVLTDSNGLAQTSATPSAAGVITLQAAEAANVLTASFNAVTRADVLALVTSPGSGVQQGATAAQQFTVRLTLADGVTPVAGSAVTFSIGGRGAGLVQFGCAAATCSVLTGVDGTASTSITGTVAGALTLLATPDASTGAGSVSMPFQVEANAYDLDALEPATYVAEGVSFGISLEALASENGMAATGQTVTWSAGTGIVLASAVSSTDANGSTMEQAQLGPFAAGMAATAQACAWPGISPQICATFRAIGVGSSQFVLTIESGGAQAATAGAAFLPLVVQVDDGMGNPVAGAAVNVYQTVTAMTAPCPQSGRCPAQPVLASKVTAIASDVNGRITISPLTVDGQATQTNLIFSSGTQGYATAVLTRQP